MYSHDVTMLDNRFAASWGSASYGLLLKDITDSRMEGNTFAETPSASWRRHRTMRVTGNQFLANGWASPGPGQCGGQQFRRNRFEGNSFDVSTNSVNASSRSTENYWDRYQGYDSRPGRHRRRAIRSGAAVRAGGPAERAGAHPAPELLRVAARRGRTGGAGPDAANHGGCTAVDAVGAMIVADGGHQTAAAVEADGVSKRFGRLEVLKDITLTIPAGRITGLVGPNAAGKSTLIKAILGLVRPDAGRLTVQGSPVNGDERYRQSIGYMPQAAQFPENLTAIEVLRMIRDLRGPEPLQDTSLIADFQLEPELRKPIRTLSGGTRQKLSAAIALLFRPSLLILDEPTAGLDPMASGIFKEKLLAARDRGASTLLASHTLAELEELADDIVFLLDGQVRFQGPVAGLMRLTGFGRLERAIAALMQPGAA